MDRPTPTPSPALLPKSDPPLRRVALDAAGAIATFTDETAADAADDASSAVLLMLHGLPGTVRDYRYLAPAMLRRGAAGRVVRLNMPGFGGSRAGHGALHDDSIAGRAAWVAAAARALALPPRRTVLVAHSYAAFFALDALVQGASSGDGGGDGGDGGGGGGDGGDGVGVAAAAVLLAPTGLRPHRGLGGAAGVAAYRVFSAAAHVPCLGTAVAAALWPGYRAIGFPASTTLEDVRAAMIGVGAVDFARQRRNVEEVRRRGVPLLVAYAADDTIIEEAVSLEMAAALTAAAGGGGDAAAVRVLAFASGGHNIQKSRCNEIAAATAEVLRPVLMRCKM